MPAGLRVWVVDGGPVAPLLPVGLEPPELVVCADSGLGHALSLGFSPDVVVGDLDSVPTDVLERWQQGASAGSTVEHPRDKAASDLELALDVALERARERSGGGPAADGAGDTAAELVVLSGGGGRVDHLLVGLLALSKPSVTAAQPTAFVGGAAVVPVSAGQRRRLPHPAGGDGGWARRRSTTSATDHHVGEVATAAGSEAQVFVTLLAVGGPARVVTTGLRWKLTAADVLLPGSTRGLSNQPDSSGAPTVEGLEGTVLAVVASEPEAAR